MKPGASDELYFGSLRNIKTMIYVCMFFFMFRWLGNDFPIKISFEICSKQLLTMRNRFLILPKPEKLNFNERLRFEVLETYQKIQR